MSWQESANHLSSLIRLTHHQGSPDAWKWDGPGPRVDRADWSWLWNASPVLSVLRQDMRNT